MNNIHRLDVTMTDGLMYRRDFRTRDEAVEVARELLPTVHRLSITERTPSESDRRLTTDRIQQVVDELDRAMVPTSASGRQAERDLRAAGVAASTRAIFAAQKLRKAR